jgi:hypothetical protein
MAANSGISVTDLYERWRKGDHESGGKLAQTISDWYYAVCTGRFGEEVGKKIFQQTSARFGAEIVQVQHAAELIDWSHKILTDEITAAEIPAEIPSAPSPYTADISPSDLLRSAKVSLPTEVNLLSAFYSEGLSEQVAIQAAPLGGVPGGLLSARYAIKHWLKQSHELPYKILPSEPDLDLLPLPLYEAGQMASPDEEAAFERWLLSDNELCMDVAEFAPISHALRNGIADLGEEPEAQLTGDGERLQVGLANLALIVGVLCVLVSILVFAFMVGFSVGQ